MHPQLCEPDSFLTETRVLGTKMAEWSFLVIPVCLGCAEHQMFGALPCLSGLAFSCGEQCPPDSFFTEAHVPSTQMNAHYAWFQYDWICEALHVWCLAVLASARAVQLQV
jgi:hypothetical protein